MVDETKVKDESYKLVEVPSNYSLAVQTPKGELLTTEQAIVEILNVLNVIRGKV